VRLGARFAFLSLLLGASAAACNAITGASERMLDPDLGELPDRDTGGDDKDTGNNGILDSGPLPDTSIPDTFIGDGDAGPIVIVVNVRGGWTSPNGATSTVVANGVKISAMDASAANNHPVIFPASQPVIPSESYTVRATVLTTTAGGTPEFGIMTRVQANGSAIVLGNVYGAAPPAFLGAMSATVSPWNPSNNAQGPAYTYIVGARYKMVVRVIGPEARAKFWISTATEPTNDQIVYPASPHATGKGVGFYTYFTHDTVLEDMVVTVP
jgi:hypothetical protein